MIIFDDSNNKSEKFWNFVFIKGGLSLKVPKLMKILLEFYFRIVCYLTDDFSHRFGLENICRGGVRLGLQKKFYNMLLLANAYFWFFKTKYTVKNRDSC